MKAGRNEPCPCGSGLKFKKCCLLKEKMPFTSDDVNNLYEKIKEKKAEPYLNIIPSIVWRNYRWRVVWNRLHYRPITETFHEFLLYILFTTLGQEWNEKQRSLEKKKQHIITKWAKSYQEWTIRNKTEGNKIPDQKMWAAKPSGEVQALISLAYDIYCLQIVNKLPSYLVKRLGNHNEFQGARYEIAVAAILVRAGFEINFLDDQIKSYRHCEFIAKHKETNIEIGIEAKSRRRKGILNEDGSFNYNKSLRGDINHLFRKARSQKPDGIPYAIFIDLNIPPTPEIPLEKKIWFGDINTILDNYGTPSLSNKEPYNFVVFTNFSYYYGGNDDVSPKGEFIIYESLYPETILSNPKLIYYILDSLRRYNQIPWEV